MPHHHPVYPQLPCYPCPHRSKCCSWGVSLVGDEEAIIRAKYGDDALIWDDEEHGWRTSVVGGACYFLRNNACSIHDQTYYPRVCRGFPWIDGETGGPYPYDRTICPELDPGREGSDPAAFDA